MVGCETDPAAGRDRFLWVVLVFVRLTAAGRFTGRLCQPALK
jgi:hypothetical protein